MAENIYSCFHYHKKCESDRERAENAAISAEEAKSVASEAVTKLDGIDTTVSNAKTEITTHANTEESEAISAITTAKNTAVSEVINSGGAPTGSLMPFAGNTAPAGWLKCDGSAVSRTTYANLFAVIGTTYGAGDGSTTFNVPNYSNARFVTSETVAVKGNGKALGLTVGSEGLHLGSGDSGLFPFSGGSYNLGTRDGSAYRSANNVGVSTNASNSGITGSVSLASACNFIIKH